MPSAIPAAMASAISGPRLVKTPSFFGLSGMCATAQDEELAGSRVVAPEQRVAVEATGRLIQVKETFTRRRVQRGAIRIDRQGASASAARYPVARDF